MSRLGLWGPGTIFPGGFKAFLDVVTRTGVGAMEVRGIFCGKGKGWWCGVPLCVCGEGAAHVHWRGGVKGG